MIIKDGLPPVDKQKVVVLTITYNHSLYIEDALKGFAMQQTDFPFLCCVFDDASTDGEQEVLKKWIETHCNINDIEVYDHPLTTILKAPDKTNVNCIYVIHLQKVNTWGKPEKVELIDFWRNKGEYIALCEGDDCWINPLKLQKQVDFLDANKEYVLSHTNHDIDNQSIYTVRKISRTLKTGNVLSLLLNRSYRVSTCTAVYRMDAYNKIPKLWRDQNFKMGDLPLWIELSQIGGFHYLKDVTAVYRVLNNSASHSVYDSNKEIDFIHSQYDVVNFYSEQLHIPYDIERNNFNMYCTILKRMYETENVNLACEYYLMLKESSYDIPFKIKLFYWGAKYKIIRLIITQIYSLLK